MTNGLNAPQRARYADHSLAVYLAPLIEGRRVAVVGPASGDVAKRMRALGAATVVAFGGAGEGVAIRALVPGAIEGLHGRVDCVVVPDAGSVDLSRVLDEARRALGSQGVIAVGTRPPEAPEPVESAPGQTGPGYYELQDALLARWSNVAMVGRGPFVGYAFAAIDGGEGGVALDTRIMPDEPAAAEAYVAVASDEALPLDAMALVQVPAGEVLAARPTEKDPGLAARVGELEGELTRRDARVKELESAAADRWVKIQRLEHDLKATEEEGRKARDRAVKLTRELDDERKLRQRVELDAQMVRRAPDLPRGVDPEELRRAQERAAQLEKDLAAVREQAESASRRATDLEREIDETQQTEAALREQLDQAERARDAARGELGRVRDAEPARPAAPPAPAPTPPTTALDADELARLRAAAESERQAAAQAQADHARLEKELYARGAELIAMREQIAARDEAVRELSFSLDAAQRGQAAEQAQRDRERAAELSALNAALAAEAHALVEQNELLRERVAHLENDVAAREAESPGGREAAGGGAPVPPPHAAAEALEKRADDEKRRADECGEALRLAEERAVRLEADLRIARDAREALTQEISAVQLELDRLRAERASVPPVDPRVIELESRLADAEGALATERGRRADAEARLGETSRGAGEIEKLRAQVGEARAQLSDARGQAIEARSQAEEARAELQRAQSAVHAAQQAFDEERARAGELTQQLGDARTDLSRQYALIASMEDRTSQVALELEGARAGYQRRVRELEREIEGLLQALEVAGAHSSDEDETLESVLKEVDTARAERRGMEMRLADAEASLRAMREVRAKTAASPAVDATRAALDETLIAEAPRPGSLPGFAPASTPPDTEPGIRNDQLLADLAETAARLAETEETLAGVREAATAAELRADELMRALEAARAQLESQQQQQQHEAASQSPRESVDSLRREAGERELLVRSLVAQLEDRDLRLRAMERRLVEDVERARRTESEIWEVELRARDQRIAVLAREMERARSSPAQEESEASHGGNGDAAHDVTALQAELAGRDQELSNLRAALENVRAGLSSILVDGRGAVVAHDLVTILRQIEEPEA